MTPAMTVAARAVATRSSPRGGNRGEGDTWEGSGSPSTSSGERGSSPALGRPTSPPASGSILGLGRSTPRRATVARAATAGTPAPASLTA